jgi:hypothetical protein
MFRIYPKFKIHDDDEDFTVMQKITAAATVR